MHVFHISNTAATAWSLSAHLGREKVSLVEGNYDLGIGILAENKQSTTSKLSEFLCTGADKELLYVLGVRALKSKSFKQKVVDGHTGQPLFHRF